MRRFAMIAGGMMLLLVPVALWMGTGIVGVLTLFAGFGIIAAVKALARNEHAAVAVASVAVALIVGVVAIVAITKPVPPQRYSQEEMEKSRAVALATGKALAAIDVQNATVARDAAVRELKVVTAQRDAAEKSWMDTKAKLDVANLAGRANAAIVMATRPDIRARAEASIRGEPEPVWDYCAHPVAGAFAPKCETAAAPTRSAQWRSYHEDHLLIAGAFVSGTVRADCSAPAQTRAIEWSRSGANWTPLRDAEYPHRAVEHGSMACA